MKLVIDKSLTNNNYEVSISLADVQVEETELFNDFGKVQINIGGVLKVTGGTDADATLGDSFKYLPTDFPVVRVFTAAQYGEKAETVAKAFADTITERITTAVTALKLKQDSFTGTTEVQL
ncbi:hypothetical protein BSK59_16335 [Paenibacillus odorifer]|uniref:hypothetical protein n=1 Tax=Paenibacillus odorifer TaxID=189426 RepID=UPI00096C039A|nr:hypothetical protein [Paenibacillus odorifer]OME54146.1 hypothetical protein BSK59_16335 [Paenibacillus odorifer]